MKKYILAAVLGIMLTAATIPQFCYYNDMRKAIAIRDTQKGSVTIRNLSGQALMVADYPENTSRWVSISRLMPGQYTATTTSGSVISFYRRP